ncbi:histidine phosphatase family protein [Streptomyces sp. A73]|nr:histidine phosphatase family protein [Streptomyces sp. A73]
MLLRHGETPLTPEKRFSGSCGSDPSLPEAGRRQAEVTAALLAARGGVRAITTSSLRRCRETAQAIAARLGLRVHVEEDLCEADFGAWEGLTFAPRCADRGLPARHHRAVARRRTGRRLRPRHPLA